MLLCLRFVRGTQIDSRLIRWQTRCWCSHVELIWGEMTFGAQLIGGVRWRELNDKAYRHVERSEIWGVPIKPSQEQSMWRFIESSDGKPYDWRSIVSFAFGERDWEEPDSWICSEWCMELLTRTGIAFLPLNLPVTRITPRDVYMIYTSMPGVIRPG